MGYSNLAKSGLVAVALMVSGAAQALIIDDFNIDAASHTAVTNGGPVNSPIAGNNIVMGVLNNPNWIRSITATLTGGVDTVETVVCAGCGAGHLNSDIPAIGDATFSYAGTGVVFDGVSLLFDYILDASGNGTTVDVLLNGSTLLTSGPLASTLTFQTASISLGSAANSVITSMDFIVHGTQAADFTVDNIRTVPVPMPIALLLLGLIGLGLNQKKIKA